MNIELRKKVLELACACDRVELTVAWRKPANPLNTATAIASNPWVDFAVSTLTPFLPRKLRLLSVLYRVWRSRPQRTSAGG